MRASDSDCTFTFQRSGDSGGTWIEFLSSTTGRGNGRMRYRVGLSASPRSGRIGIAEGSGSCGIRQALPLRDPHGPAALMLTTTLDATGARGQILLNGSVMWVERGRAFRNAVLEAGVHRLDAVLVTAAGRPGSWTFVLAGRYVPGSLRVLAGQPARATESQITFALSGRPGERVAFTFRTDE